MTKKLPRANRLENRLVTPAIWQLGAAYIRAGKPLGAEPLNYQGSVARRVYREWSRGKSPHEMRAYRGEAFDCYVEEETHYHLERLGHRWNGDDGCFEGLTHVMYRDAVMRVLDAVVQSSERVFSPRFICVDSVHPELPFRVSLEAYLNDSSGNRTV